MLPKGSITILQASMVLIMAIGLDNHVTIIPLLLHTANKDSWISVILVLPLCLLWTLLPYWIAKKTRQTNILSWLRTHAHPALALLLLVPFLSFFLTNAFVTFKEVIVWTRTSYLPETPILVTALSLLALCVYSAMKGIRSIAICAGVLLPAVWVLGYFVMSANFQFKRYALLFPLFTNRFSSIASCMMYAAGSFIEIFILVLIQHHIRGKFKWYHLMILVLIISGLTIGPLAGSIASFGYKSAQIRYPTFEQWRLVRIGDYVSHLDFLSIYQWLAGAFIRISLMLYLIADLLKSKSERSRKYTIAIVAGILLLLVAIPMINDMVYLRIVRWYYIGAFAIILFSSLWLLLTVVWTARKKGAGA
ncbi:endospore germination permease [Cohnella nanjingensis]|uniref:Endospore germination permease n=1 Tax=Cohnella nanjingensis TaxID=1387779 RepID=A0A7X0VGZ2_9BACL|nr:endospore germination permease [Cohnella nanjingensis]MBB6672938.1 endospore germination permease [Cohnella nanjingensis]